MCPFQKGYVKGTQAVLDECAITGKIQKHSHGIVHPRLSDEHRVTDAVDLTSLQWDGPVNVDERGELVQHTATLYADGPDLDNCIAAWIQSGSFDIHGHKRDPVKRGIGKHHGTYRSTRFMRLPRRQ